MSDSATPWSIVRQAPLSFTISHRLLKLVSVESMMLTILSSTAPFSFAFDLSQHLCLFQWAGFSHQVAKVLEYASVKFSSCILCFGFIELLGYIHSIILINFGKFSYIIYFFNFVPTSLLFPLLWGLLTVLFQAAGSYPTAPGCFGVFLSQTFFLCMFCLG